MEKSEELYFCELPTKSSSYSKDSTVSSSKESSSHSMTENRIQKRVKKQKRRLSSDSSSEELKKHKKNIKYKHKKKCKKRHKKSKESKKLKSENKHCETLVKSRPTDTTEECREKETYGPQIPDEILLKAQTMAPMSKEKWNEKNNTIRRVYDEETGRNRNIGYFKKVYPGKGRSNCFKMRLIRGDGEIIEEIVSRKRHCEINKQATFNSGTYFQAKLSSTDSP